MTSTKVQSEREPYLPRIAALALIDEELKRRLANFPGLLSFTPSPAGCVRHRMLVLANQLLASGKELLNSIQLLWRSGHFLAGAHCIRLLFEVWGMLLYAQAKVLRKAENGDPETADQRLQRLLMGTSSAPLLPAGITDHIAAINVMEFIRTGDEAVADFEKNYKLLCDVSHPTIMHFDFILLSCDGSWANDIYAKEARRILDAVVGTAEMAVKGIRLDVVNIYDACLPPLIEEIRNNSPSRQNA